MGALIDYAIVSIIVMIFRIKLPDASRPFKCPYVFVIAPIALLASLYLLLQQMIDEDFNIMLTGKLIMYWFLVMFVLYIIRSFFIKRT